MEVLILGAVANFITEKCRRFDINPKYIIVLISIIYDFISDRLLMMSNKTLY